MTEGAASDFCNMLATQGRTYTDQEFPKGIKFLVNFRDMLNPE